MIGVLSAGCPVQHTYAPGELETLGLVAQLAAVALANIEGREALARQVRQVQTLYDAGEKLGGISDEKELLNTAARMLVAEMGYLSCWIGIVDLARRVLRHGAVAGHGSDHTERQQAEDPREYPLDDTSVMACATIQGGRPIAFSDVQARADAEGWGAAARAAGIRSLVQVPLRTAGLTIGVLAASAVATRFPEDELSLIAAFGNQLAGAVMRVRGDRERAEQVTSLQQAYERQAKLLEVVRELSTPVIPVHDGVLVLPLVGTIDSTRSAQIMDSLLSAVQRESASVVIVDVTGVPMVDSSVANHLLQAIAAASLLGARCVLVGISPVVAQTMVQLGIDLRGVATRGDLQAGIAHALRTLQLEIRPMAATRR
jgi:rsbT co-antagonist protein RsbR